ncbi:MAG: DUF58 domain-containing protein [Planctomycetota bacterium]
MTVPTRWALVCLTVGLGAGALAAVDRRWVLVMGAIDVAVLGAVLWQGRRLSRTAVRGLRLWSGQPQVGQPAALQIVLENHSEGPLRLSARQVWPDVLRATDDRWSVVLRPHEQAAFDVEVTPRGRGQIVLPALEIDVSRPAGALALAAHRRKASHGGEVTVLPSLAGLKAYDALRRSRAFRAAGFHRQRMVGIGREFDQMREYVAGDDFRDINWKATARSGEPRTNQYQAERARDVVLCVDGGRMMGHPVGGQTTLDHAVDAALLLSRAGHDQGDRVGLTTFRDRIDTVIRPGTTNGPSILRCLAEFDSRPVFPSYLALVEQLRARQTHRGLIFILTDLGDPQLAADLVELMPLLVRRHLVVAVSLRDAQVERIASGRAGPGREAVSRVLAARSMAQERAERSRQLVKAGVQVLEADAEQLSLAVINHYMSVKARQLI